jgi:hypothetical protein
MDCAQIFGRLGVRAKNILVAKKGAALFKAKRLVSPA